MVELRSLLGRSAAPILIDQEGNVYNVCGPPYWRKAQPFKPLSKRGNGLATTATRLNSDLLATKMIDFGTDINCAPVADVPADGAHGTINSYAYSCNPEIAAPILAHAACEGFLAGGVLTVIRHIPSHGRVRIDSHLELPMPLQLSWNEGSVG